MENLASIILGHPFWQGLNRQHFDLLIPGATWGRFSAGEIIAREGEEAHQFHLLLRGEVAVETSIPGEGPVAIQTLREGDAVGWSWLFPPYHWHFTCRALTEVETIVWDTRILRARAEENPAFGYELARRMSNLLLQRLHATQMQLVDYFASEA